MLLRSEQQLKDEQAEVEQAAAAEAELREALAAKKKEERLAVARSLKTQIKLREKELERARLEAMITGEPQFPGEPPQSSRRSFVNLDGERKTLSDVARVLCADTERGLLDAEDMKKEAPPATPASLRRSPATRPTFSTRARAARAPRTRWTACTIASWRGWAMATGSPHVSRK